MAPLGIPPSHKRRMQLRAIVAARKPKKKIAESLSYLDIVGVKLGMTPKEAFAAIHAYNPKMKIDIINSRMEPPTAPGTFVRVPHYAIARIVGPPGRGLNAPENIYAPDGSAERIGLEFTTPPYPAVVARVTRIVTFPTTQPVVASNLSKRCARSMGRNLFRRTAICTGFSTPTASQ